MSAHAVFSAARIAELMAEAPERAIRPTPQQAEVIEQPLGDSVLVVAGAGSGKTETMANRVVWLVANGLAAPSQILGLTFTRKAAGELGARITERLMRFAAQLDHVARLGQLNAQELVQAEALTTLLSDGLDLPEVSTYNAFASAIVQEFGASAGVAAGATVIDASRAWAIAREVVRESTDPGLVHSSDSVGVIVKQLMTLDHAVSDNLTSFAAVRRSIRRLDRLGSLPYNEKKAEGQYAGVRDVLANMQATKIAVNLAEQFSCKKRELGYIEFSDQLALAVETLQRSEDAVRVLRSRTPVVLLDEVQDTSVGQTTLLSTLFRGSSVMAVGDPHQSIYGFRGASASNLQTFHRDFRDLAINVGADTTLTLSTSWRNPSSILAAANAISSPLAARLTAEATAITVRPLTSRAQYLGVPEPLDQSRLELLVTETVGEEFSALATWMRDARGSHLAQTGEPPTAAVVFRNRHHMAAVAEALWAAGVPNRIVGLGGLLTTPEVTDLVSALRCVWYADADNELLRLLAGPRFRLGVADLRGLSQAAVWFSQRDHQKHRISDAELAATMRLTDPERSFTLLDTLDEIAEMPRLDHNALEGITVSGRQRLREAGQMLRGLRQEVGGDILSLLHSTVAALRLDIELDAAEHTGHEGSAVARANLESFSDMVENFLLSDEQGTLDSVLAWLERATEDDEAAEHVPEPEPGTVQLITVHGSKGLEWDLVAIPRLVADEFPGNAREGLGWLRPGQLPDELRGDSAARPRLNLEVVGTQKEAVDAISAYKDALKDRHSAEERRLAYVAITRAASRLLLSCSFWGAQKNARQPSVFLLELANAGLVPELPEQSAYERNPTSGTPRTMQWPLQPLGRREKAVHAAAGAVRRELDEIERGVTPPPVSLHPVVELLLAERAELASKSNPTGSPNRGETADRGPSEKSGEAAPRLTASTFHEFIEDPVEAERRRLRPLPVRPYRRTRTGNLFHEWVERRASTAMGTSLALSGLDFDSDTASLSEPREELDELIAQFEHSRWAQKQPLAVELEITLPFAGRTLVCKLDAVYREDDTAMPRYEIVDWKSGRPPKTDEERSLRFLQLDLYRHAYARWAAVDPEHIDVTLFYVAEGQELRGEVRRSFEELEQLWRTVQL